MESISQVKINSINYSSPKKWIKTSWNLVKENYEVLFGLSLINFFWNCSIDGINGFSVGLLFLGGVLSFITIVIVKKLTQKKPVNFLESFFIFEEKGIMFRLLPYFIFYGAFEIVSFVAGSYSYRFFSDCSLLESCFRASLSSLSFSLLFFDLIVIFFFLINTFTLPLMVFKSFTFRKAFSLSLNVSLKNFGPILLFYLIIVLFFIFSLLSLGTVTFFILLPLIIASKYVVYADVFQENALDNH